MTSERKRVLSQLPGFVVGFLGFQLVLWWAGGYAQRPTAAPVVAHPTHAAEDVVDQDALAGLGPDRDGGAESDRGRDRDPESDLVECPVAADWRSVRAAAGLTNDTDKWPGVAE